MSRLSSLSRSPRVPAARSSSGFGAVRAVSTRRLRSVPYAAAGAVFVLAAIVMGAMAIVSVGGRLSVLVVARPVQVGQTFTADDLKVVNIRPGTLDQVVPFDDEAQVVGQPAALPLVTGQVLTRSLIGAAAWPPAGFAVATAALKPGSFPPHLVAGARVQVVAPASAAGAAAQTVAKAATVTEVSVPSDQGDVVVSLLADQNEAKAVASATADSLSLVLLPAGN